METHYVILQFERPQPSSPSHARLRRRRCADRLRRDWRNGHVRFGAGDRRRRRDVGFAISVVAFIRHGRRTREAAVVSVKVNIENPAASSDDLSGQMDNLPPQIQQFFKRFGNQNGMPPRQTEPQRAIGLASGFFISADGYVVTNNHVVANAKTVTVTTNDGKALDAKVIGTDPKTDLALLKVTENGDYPFVSFAKETPRVGDWVVAVGNPYGLGGTVTAGIISAEGRDIGEGPYDSFLQIDAPINKGNSADRPST